MIDAHFLFTNTKIPCSFTEKIFEMAEKKETEEIGKLVTPGAPSRPLVGCVDPAIPPFSSDFGTSS